jgi:hypothetical protein
VTVSHLLGAEYERLEGHCRDLSKAGMSILLATELSHGDVVSLTFALPGSALPWEVRAVVRYRRGYQYGLEFLSLTQEQQVLLESYLESLELSD